ncbi:hypothetical protein ADL01_05195 [Streptomyces sp. NRRL WC-3618]|nr:hypothetical protein ADL01_05195 [Streptomyces sp. NRRL WC-3618]
MVTAWSPWRTARARFHSGPVRVLTFAVLLLGLLLAHGATVESAKGHLSTSAVVALGGPVEAGHGVAGVRGAFLAVVTDGHMDHDFQNPGEHCASGQSQQASTGASPCFAVSVREPGVAASTDPRTGRAGVDLREAAAVAMRASVVQRV